MTHPPPESHAPTLKAAPPFQEANKNEMHVLAKSARETRAVANHASTAVHGPIELPEENTLHDVDAHGVLLPRLPARPPEQRADREVDVAADRGPAARPHVEGPRDVRQRGGRVVVFEDPAQSTAAASAPSPSPRSNEAAHDITIARPQRPIATKAASSAASSRRALRAWAPAEPSDRAHLDKTANTTRRRCGGAAWAPSAAMCRSAKAAAVAAGLVRREGRDELGERRDGPGRRHGTSASDAEDRPITEPQA